MTGLTLVAYAADAAILGTYAVMASGRRSPFPFHCANAIGAPPIVATEIAARAWPALVLTVAFGCIGWVGMLTHRPQGAA